MSSAAEEYLLFSSKINEFVSAAMFGLGMDARNYDYEVVWEYILNKGITLRGFPFSGKARQSISGMILQDEFEITLTYNSNMGEKRKKFTISHEMIHFLYHFNKQSHFFTDTRETLKYSSTDLLYEFQANIGASAILLPEPVFIHELKEGRSISFISNDYGISEAAIYMRLVQTMQSYFRASDRSASRTAMKIMNGHGKGTMKELGRNLENRVITINPFYEALCT